MTVDMIDLRDQAITQMKAAAETVQNNVSLLDVGVVLISVGVLAALNAVYKDWRKKKGYRMVLRDRNDKAHALLLDIINDGLFEAECAGKISTKEVNALYAEMSKKLGLHDLIPKQRMVKITKEELKRKRFGGEKKNSKFREWAEARTPKKFAEYVGKYKFRKAA